MVSPTKNILHKIPLDLPEEVFETLIDHDNIKIERIVSKGHHSPDNFWYDQAEHEFVLVLKGEAKLILEDHEVFLQTGDYINIPAHKKHRVAWTPEDTETIWLAIFY